MYEEDIAKICHEANRALCEGLGDTSQELWENAPEWQKESALDGVYFHLQNLDASPSSSHENWLAEKKRTGWKYGDVKDADLKTHPCFLPFDQLPLEQQAKDVLFKNIVEALRDLL